MGFFTRRSKWDLLIESVAATAAKKAVRDGSKITLGVVGSAVAVTAASAAVSAIRHQDDS